MGVVSNHWRLEQFPEFIGSPIILPASSGYLRSGFFSEFEAFFTHFFDSLFNQSLENCLVSIGRRRLLMNFTVGSFVFSAALLIASVFLNLSFDLTIFHLQSKVPFIILCESSMSDGRGFLYVCVADAPVQHSTSPTTYLPQPSTPNRYRAEILCL